MRRNDETPQLLSPEIDTANSKPRNRFAYNLKKVYFRR